MSVGSWFHRLKNRNDRLAAKNKLMDKYLKLQELSKQIKIGELKGPEKKYCDADAVKRISDAIKSETDKKELTESDKKRLKIIIDSCMGADAIAHIGNLAAKQGLSEDEQSKVIDIYINNTYVNSKEGKKEEVDLPDDIITRAFSY